MDRLTVATHSQKLSLWIKRIGECRASNQKVSDWCTAHDVSIKSYYYWFRKINREAFDAIPAERKPKVQQFPPSSLCLLKFRRQLPISAHQLLSTSDLEIQL